jgi:hypothetical protein
MVFVHGVNWYKNMRQIAIEMSGSKRLESVINTAFHRNYRGGLVNRIQEYEDAFTELPLLGQKTWDDDEIKKRRFV